MLSKSTNGMWEKHQLESKQHSELEILLFIIYFTEFFFQNYFILQWLSDYSKMIAFKSKSRLKASDIALKENVAKVK